MNLRNIGEERKKKNTHMTRLLTLPRLLVVAVVFAALFAARPPTKIAVQTALLPVVTRILALAGYPSKGLLAGLDPQANPVAFAAAAARVRRRAAFFHSLLRLLTPSLALFPLLTWFARAMLGWHELDR